MSTVEMAWKEQLHIEYDHILFSYRIKMSKPLLGIHSDSTYWGFYDPNRRLISLHSRLIQEYRWDDVVQILKHEIAHQYVFEVMKIKDSSHGVEFQKACEILGVAKWASKASDTIRGPLQKEEMDHEQSPMIRKAHRLLALSRSENTHEAKLALTKLEELSRKYHIHDLEQDAQTQFSYTIINHKKKRIPQHQSRLASLLQKYFFVEIIFSEEYDAQHLCTHKTMEIMGSRNNVEMAEYTYHFLFNQLQVLWKREKNLGLSGLQDQRAFFLGILESFESKLEQTTASEGNLSGLIRVNQQLSRYKKI